MGHYDYQGGTKGLMQTPLNVTCAIMDATKEMEMSYVIWGEVVQYLFFCHFNICDLKTGTETCLAQRKERGFRV